MEGTAVRPETRQARYDATCKRLLSERSVLARILKACVPEFAGCPLEVIERVGLGGAGPGADGGQPADGAGHRVWGIRADDALPGVGSVAYDVALCVRVPSEGGETELVMDVEAQSKFNPGYALMERAQYYCARLLSAQQGTLFSKSHYENLRRTY